MNKRESGINKSGIHYFGYTGFGLLILFTAGLIIRAIGEGDYLQLIIWIPLVIMLIGMLHELATYKGGYEV